jgi:hypothetical protein
MKLISKKTLTGVLAAMVFALVAVFSPAPAYATTPTVNNTSNAPSTCVNGATGGVSAGASCGNVGGVPTNLFGAGGIFTTVVNVLLFIIGAIAVIMLIWGGIRYTTSGGTSANVTAAKNTIMYAIIGLVVAFLAFAIVNWVLTAL